MKFKYHSLLLIAFLEQSFEYHGVMGVDRVSCVSEPWVESLAVLQVESPLAPGKFTHLCSIS